MQEFKLPDMTCGGCASKVTLALQRVDPRCEVQIDLPSHEVKVQSSQPRETLADALRGAGFEPA
jgi:copper chaperone